MAEWNPECYKLHMPFVKERLDVKLCRGKENVFQAYACWHSHLSAVEPQQLLTAMNKALTLLQNYTVNTLGQNTVFPGANICTPNTTAGLRANDLAVCKAPSIVASAYKTTFP